MYTSDVHCLDDVHVAAPQNALTNFLFLEPGATFNGHIFVVCILLCAIQCVGYHRRHNK
jgi:hypothetical protein